QQLAPCGSKKKHRSPIIPGSHSSLTPEGGRGKPPAASMPSSHVSDQTLHLMQILTSKSHGIETIELLK
ncbi:hypothetical protein KUCAC02_002365, partial [Chaenocephalus aceratus]